MNLIPEIYKKTSKIAIWVIVLAILAVLAFWIEGNTHFIKQQLVNVKLIPQPERYTELYFENHLNLPKKSVAGESIRFAFTVHNLEGQKLNYPYVVYFRYEDGSRYVMRRGNISLEHNQSKTTVISYTFNTSDLDGKVVVELVDLKQDINFSISSN